MNNSDILRKTLLFTKLDEKQLAELVSHIEEISFPAGQTIIKEGDRADFLYVIKEGAIQVFTLDIQLQEVVLARLEKGDFVGEQALLFTTPGRRNASVRTLTEVILLKIHHADFLKIIESDVELMNVLKKAGTKQLLSALQVKEPDFDFSTPRGEMTLYMDLFLHMPATTCKFNLNDGREVLTTYVIGKNIRSIREANLDNSTSLTYESKTVYRELLLVENRLVGVVAYGEWNALKELYTRVFEKRSLSDEEIKNFKQQGDITFREVISEENEEEIICNCMYLARGEISACIKNGCTSVEEIGINSGAGTVCGSCAPTLQSMLGHQSWMAMHILQVDQLTPDARAYRLGSIQNKPLKPFQAGQHVVIECEINGNWIERSYTLVSAPGNTAYYEIAIKREDKGLLSRWIFENEEKIPFLRVSYPSGKIAVNFTLFNPMVCFTAGIGITPVVGFARAHHEKKASRPLHIYTTAHNQEFLAYDTEMKTLAGQNQQIKYNTHLTQEKGRMTPEDIINIVQQHPDADYFICGPKGFESIVKTALQQASISLSKIITEQFTHAGGPARPSS